MNQNHILTDRWSNDDSLRLYELRWPDELQVRERCDEGEQCGGCSFFAKFNFD